MISNDEGAMDGLGQDSILNNSKLNSLKNGSVLDWAGHLLAVLHQSGQNHNVWRPTVGSNAGSSSRPISALEKIIYQLNLPPGWPQSDPGYYLASQLLTDSSLFRMVSFVLRIYWLYDTFYVYTN